VALSMMDVLLKSMLNTVSNLRSATADLCDWPRHMYLYVFFAPCFN
jgi:hypothetical protein